MSEMTFEDAKAALSEAAAAPEPSSSIAPAPAASEPAAASTPEVDSGATTQDSFSQVDPNSLPPELRNVYSSMQADYTRKTQEIAETRKAFDGIDPDRARQSVEFINALETDPNFVMSVHAQLTEALTASGYTPAEARAAAADAINETATTQQDPSLGEYEDPETSQLAKEVAELRAWRENQEAQQYEQNLAAQLQRQEMGIRAADPTLKEAEIDRIYELAFAHGGDLSKAHQAYAGWKQDLLGEYIEAKSNAPQVTVPDSTGHSVVPPSSSWTLDEGHEMAKQHLANILANS